MNIFIDADELLTYWDELWEDHRVTQSELHHIIKDEWSDIHRYTLEELSEKNWHYPSKGEYPTENGFYWTAVKSERKSITYHVQMYDANIKYWGSGFLPRAGVAPYAWQYIIPPPKEEE